MKFRLIDLTGKRFGRLTVIKRVANNKHNQLCWLCRCKCGLTPTVAGYALKNGHTKSCGCLHKELSAKICTDNFLVHGHSIHGKESLTYRIWCYMLRRCTNRNSKEYHYYGGRGITVCERWRKFTNFLEDMGERPEKHQIDRINNDSGYYKENCRWVTSKTNNRNRRNNHLVTYNGKTQCIAAWAEEYGLRYHTLYKRLSKCGWPIHKALTTSVRKYI